MAVHRVHWTRREEEEGVGWAGMIVVFSAIATSFRTFLFLEADWKMIFLPGGHHCTRPRPLNDG